TSITVTGIESPFSLKTRVMPALRPTKPIVIARFPITQISCCGTGNTGYSRFAIKCARELRAHPVLFGKNGPARCLGARGRESRRFYHKVCGLLPQKSAAARLFLPSPPGRG